MVNKRLNGREFGLIRISLPIRYALEGMRDLACHYGTGYRRIEQTAKQCDLPLEFLSKIFSRLSARRLLDSQRGPGGGFMLSREPLSIRVSEILEALDEPGVTSKRECLMGHNLCGGDNPCPMHATVVRMEKGLMAKLKAITLKELAELRLP